MKIEITEKVTIQIKAAIDWRVGPDEATAVLLATGEEVCYISVFSTVVTREATHDQPEESDPSCYEVECLGPFESLGKCRIPNGDIHVSIEFATKRMNDLSQKMVRISVV